MKKNKEEKQKVLSTLPREEQLELLEKEAHKREKSAAHSARIGHASVFALVIWLMKF